MEDERILTKFESLLKEVDVAYTVYKINKDAKAPLAKRRQLEQLYSNLRNKTYNSNINNYKKANLLQKFNLLKDRWESIIDAKEIGIIKGTKVEYSAIRQQTAPTHEKNIKSEKTQTIDYEQVYDRFKKANAKLGKKVTADFDKFKEFLVRMEANVKTKTKAKAIDFVVKIEGGKPVLKARIKK